MFKFVRKNKKLIGVVFGILLMVMFLGNLSPQQNQRSSAVFRTVADLGGQKVTQLDINNATAKWQLLKTLTYVEPSNQNFNPITLLRALLGEDFTSQIDQAQRGSESVPLFFLLTKEAQQQGIIVSPEQVETLVNSHVVPAGDPNSDDRDRVDDAVHDLLMVNQLIDRATSVIKISRPYQQYQLARMGQEIALKVTPIFASRFESQLPAPSAGDIQEQYDQYSNRPPARPAQIPSEFGAAGDPLGFGYKIPNRIQLQYIGLNHDDIRRAAKASKSDEDWYVAAFNEFQKNRDDYDQQDIPTTNPSSTQPAAPQKVDDLNADFALHVPLVLDHLYDDQTRSLLEDIRKDVEEQLSAGYGSYRDATASGAGTTTGPAADYMSFDFMQKIADSIRTKFGVSPILGNIQQPKTIDELTQLEGIGQSILPLSQTEEIRFNNYAVQYFQPWISDAEKNSRRGALALAPWQPSSPVYNMQQNVYVFRITAGDPAHVPPLADVKTQVAADFQTAVGYNKALAAAQSLLTEANHTGLDAAAVTLKYASPILTDPFDAESITNGRATPAISPLTFLPDSARELAKTAQQLLITPAMYNHRPQLIAQLYADRVVSVIELDQAKPAWDSRSETFFIAEFMQELQQSKRVPLELALFSSPAVQTRLNYHSTEPKSGQ